jgi:alpha-L-fucosidase
MRIRLDSAARLLLCICALCSIDARAEESGYIPETDPLALKKLAQWQDWKFGFLMHWGPYSQWGIVESWSICSEDVPWCKRPPGVRYDDYKKQYEQLPTTFDPQKFDPARWAKQAKDAGMKYVVFTTKHHDGFAMFDTHVSDYRITAANVPFHNDPRANIAKEVFTAFRKQGFGTGAYFSKPDWHHADYWAPEWATPDRNVNYDTRKHPERWLRFVDYTHRQIGELTSEYGPLDILWLDGGWVDSKPNPHALPGSGQVPWPQDIDMSGIAAIARKNQPGILIVNRAVGGRWENYRTPEQEIPAAPLPYPWETCMTLGDSWSYAPHENYKPARKVVHMLVDVVAKGGNYLLNVGPDANGELPAEALARMREIGAWMKVNGEAIYASHPLAPYQDGKLRYTALRDGSVYAIYLLDENEAVPERIFLHGLAPAPRAHLRLVGRTHAPLAWTRAGDKTIVEIPQEERARLVGAYAFAVHIPSIAR